MHPDEVDVPIDLVADLLMTQWPHVAGRELRRLDTWGTDHVIYRLGHDLSVRLPKIGWAAGQAELESRWLPVLAPQLPAAVPVPVSVGAATARYPYAWYVAPWIPGGNPARSDDLVRLAVDLAAFVVALQGVDADGGPPPRAMQRGGPLARADGSTRARAEDLRGQVDVDALVRVWELGLLAGDLDGPGRWVHGDLTDGNVLLTDAGGLAGVIDWGGLKVGDPAVDLMIAWSLFDPVARDAYRTALGFVDDAMWLRGRAWAASAAVHALPYYRLTNRDIVARSWRTVRAVLGDLASPG